MTTFQRLGPDAHCSLHSLPELGVLFTASFPGFPSSLDTFVPNLLSRLTHCSFPSVLQVKALIIYGSVSVHPLARGMPSPSAALREKHQPICVILTVLVSGTKQGESFCLHQKPSTMFVRQPSHVVIISPLVMTGPPLVQISGFFNH